MDNEKETAVVFPDGADANFTAGAKQTGNETPDTHSCASRYAKLYTNAEVNRLKIFKPSQSQQKEDRISNVISFEQDDFVLRINNAVFDKDGKILIKDKRICNRVLRISAHKLLDVCRMLFTNRVPYGKNDSNPEIILSVEQYMELMGIPDTDASRKKAFRTMDEDMTTLSSIDIDILKEGMLNRLPGHTGIFDYWEPIQGGIIFRFSTKMSYRLKTSYVTYLHLDALKLDNRKAIEYRLATKLVEHALMYSNQERGTANTISMQTLLDACPELPSVEEVSQRGESQYYQLLVSPLERGLNALKNTYGILEDWKQCDAKGSGNKKKKDMGPIDDIKNGYIHFVLKNPPDLTDDIAVWREKKNLSKQTKTPRRKKTTKKE